MNPHKNLQDLRQEINFIDQELQVLMNRRAQLAQNIAHIKRQTCDDPQSFYRPEREAHVLSEIERRNHGPLSTAGLQRIFREIMSECLALESPLRVSYLGPEGSYTYIALLHQFGQAVAPIPCLSFSQTCDAIRQGSAHYGILAIHNSETGYIHDSLQALIQSSLIVIDEIKLKIEHALLSASPRSQIKRLYAHPQAFLQCQQNLTRSFTELEYIEVGSSSLAFERMCDDSQSAAIAHQSLITKDHKDINLIESNLSDSQENITRFWVIGAPHTIPAFNPQSALIPKTYLFLDTPQSLTPLLSHFSAYQISVQHISNHPTYDLIEILGHPHQELMREMMRGLNDQITMGEIKVLGVTSHTPRLARI